MVKWPAPSTFFVPHDFVRSRQFPDLQLALVDVTPEQWMHAGRVMHTTLMPTRAYAGPVRVLSFIRSRALSEAIPGAKIGGDHELGLAVDFELLVMDADRFFDVVHRGFVQALGVRQAESLQCDVGVPRRTPTDRGRAATAAHVCRLGACVKWLRYGRRLRRQAREFRDQLDDLAELTSNGRTGGAAWQRLVRRPRWRRRLAAGGAIVLVAALAARHCRTLEPLTDTQRAQLRHDVIVGCKIYNCTPAERAALLNQVDAFPRVAEGSNE